MQLRGVDPVWKWQILISGCISEVVTGKAAQMQHNWLFLSQALVNTLPLSFKVPSCVPISDLQH